MSANFAVLTYGPGAGTAVSVTSTASAGTLLVADAKYRFIASAATFVRFGSTSAVTAVAAADVWIPANVPVDYTVKAGTPYVSFVTATTANLAYAIVG